MKDNIAFIGFDSLHPCHRGFAESIGADVIEMTGFSQGEFRHFRNAALYFYYTFKLAKYDSVICEETFSMRSGYLAKRLFGVDFYRLIADEDYIYLNDGEIESKSLVHMSRYLDGAIAVSKLARESAEPFIQAPIEIAYPYISDSFREKLQGVDVETEKGKILSVGYNRPNKGFDRLVRAFQEAKKENEDLKLFLIGKGHEEYSEIEGIETPGYVTEKQLAEHYRSAELYVQASYGDTFPVTVLEALEAGTPVLISEKVGEKELLDEECIFRSQEDLEEKVKNTDYVMPSVELPRFYERQAKKRFESVFGGLKND